MGDRPRKKATSRPSGAASRSRPKPSARPASPRRLVVQFKALGDPPAEQTEKVRAVVKKFASKAAVKGDYPGAVRVEVAPDAEDQLRRSLVDELPEWEVASEGTAKMPPKPLLEE